MLRLLSIFLMIISALLAVGGSATAATSDAKPSVRATATPAAHQTAAVNSSREDIQAIQTFNKLREDETGILKVEAQKKHKILFIMGVALLIGILTTAGLGLAMVLGDKPVFMWHMAVAGITVTLAIAHAVTSIVWFFPF